MEGFAKLPKPLPNEQTEDDYYCSIDSSYCKPKEMLDVERKKAFNTVCSIKDGTVLCNDEKVFEQFYLTPPPVCNSEGCEPKRVLNQRDIMMIYKAFLEYYGNVLFTKVKDNETHSVYACKVASSLMKDNQHLFCTVKRDKLAKGTTRILSVLEWDSFQTRKVDEGYNLPDVKVKNNISDIMKSEIKVFKRTDECSQYRCEKLPLVITLLHKKWGFKDQYNPVGKLYLALNSFDCVITF
jgi:hypothetical protein